MRSSNSLASSHNLASYHDSERAHRVADGMVVGERVGDGRLVVPAAAVVHLERVEIVVTAAEHRRPQRADQRELIGGVVDRLQHQQEVADLGGGVHERRGLGAVRDGRAVERVLELAERRAGREQDRDVARAARFPGERAVGAAPTHCPALGEGGAHGGGHVGRFEVAHLGCRHPLGLGAVDRHVGVGLDPQQHHRRAVHAVVVTLGIEGHVLGLRLGHRHDQVAEHVVHEVDHRTGRTKVPGEAMQRPAERVAGAQERGDVGAPEPVDRLLGVAHHEQSAGVDGDLIPALGARFRRARCEQRRNVTLDRVGVLEFVEEQVRVALPQPPPNVDAVLGIAQHRARQHEQVVELERAGASPRLGLGHGELGDLPGDAPDRGLGHRSCAVGGEPAQRGHLVAHRRHVARPVALLARLGAEFRETAVQHAELLVLVGCGARVPGPLDEQGQARGELVVVGRALVGARHHPVECVEHAVGVERRRLGLGSHALLDEVPVGVAGERDGAQRGAGGVGIEGEEQWPFDSGVVEQLVEETGPALLERHLRRDVVEDLDTGREAGLDRVLHEEPLRERVQGRHRGAVEIVEGGGGACRRHRMGVHLIRIDGHAFEFAADAVAQLGGRLLGERDGHDLAHRHVGHGDQRDHAVDQ